MSKHKTTKIPHAGQGRQGKGPESFAEASEVALIYHKMNSLVTVLGSGSCKGPQDAGGRRAFSKEKGWGPPSCLPPYKAAQRGHVASLTAQSSSTLESTLARGLSPLTSSEIRWRNPSCSQKFAPSVVHSSVPHLGRRGTGS